MTKHCAVMLKKNVSTLSHFPSAMQNTEVPKEETLFIQTSGAVCVQAPPVCSQVKYFKVAPKHKNMKTKLLFVFAARIGKLSRIVKNQREMVIFQFLQVKENQNVAIKIKQHIVLNLAVLS